ncbi:hypothetical protein LTS17_010453 [Exophiala oligosperma]
MATRNRQSKRKADALNVPQVGEDAAERKRVLNVLAQRRYRQRRKEHMEKLEAQVESIATSTEEPGWSAMPHTTQQDQIFYEERKGRRNGPTLTKFSTGLYDDSPETRSSTRILLDADDGGELEICGGCGGDDLDFAPFLPIHMQPDVLPNESQVFVVDEGGQEVRGAKGNETAKDIFATFDEHHLHHNHQQLLVTDHHQYFFAPSTLSSSSSTTTTPLILPSLDSPSTTTSDGTTTITTHHPSSVIVENPAAPHWSSLVGSFGPLPGDFEKDSTNDAEGFHFPRDLSISSTIVANHTATPAGPVIQQHPTTTTTTFPDDMHLQVPELALLRGCMSIAQRLQIQDLIWSLTSESPFPLSSATPTTMDAATVSGNGRSLGSSPTTTSTSTAILYGHLPPNLRPTAAQLSIPHHPAIDLLPWPSVRDRLIHVLAQPIEYRPLGAKSPTALVDFVYDIEDPAEGVRITGSDPQDPRNWEVGEKVFRGWWWCFDREIVKRTNELRRARGVSSPLGVVGGSTTLGTGAGRGSVVDVVDDHLT